MARIVSFPMVPIEHRPAVPVAEPRQYRARRFYDDCEGNHVAQLDAEAKPRSEGCRERIRQAMMGNDVGQRRLHAAEQRLAPAGGQQASATRVEVAQDEEMTETLAASSAGRVRPRSAEMSSRMEDDLPWRKRGSVERGACEDPMLEPADGSEMGISAMAVILKSLGVASASGEVAEWICRNRLGGTAVDMGFERGPVVSQVTGRANDNVGQQRLRASEQRVSPTGEQPSVATRVEAAQEGLGEARRQALVASSTREASLLRATLTWLIRTRWVERSQCRR